MTIRAYRGEILSVGRDPLHHPDAVAHQADGLLVVEDGIVVARGPHAELASQFAGVPIEPLPGLIVPGFISDVVALLLLYPGREYRHEGLGRPGLCRWCGQRLSG